MNEVLRNPIYNALISGNSSLAIGDENVKYFRRDVAFFAGLKDNSDADFEELYRIIDSGCLFVVFSPTQLQFSEKWNLAMSFTMFQMVYESEYILAREGNEVIDLDESHVEEMIALVDLTKPGPFLKSTLEFGNYTGVFKDDKLVAMAGHRFNAIPYTEISAVCTHPDYLGRGFSYLLLREQIRRILDKAEIPFLHVKKDNIGAIKLYEKVGFRIKSEIIAHIIEKV